MECTRHFVLPAFFCSRTATLALAGEWSLSVVRVILLVVMTVEPPSYFLTLASTGAAAASSSEVAMRPEMSNRMMVGLPLVPAIAVCVRGPVT